MRRDEFYCTICGSELLLTDLDLNDEPNCKCAKCVAEEAHDFDVEPLARFNRQGVRTR